MNWPQLLQAYRYGDLKARNLNEVQNRSIFEQDYDRIIFSTAFRRLQDKTQVIPLPEHDFVHNRLTHSIEVSSVGRSLGKIAGQELINKYPHLQREYNLSHHDFGAIVAAASLAHDIGNPPFGHSGEASISEYFLNGKGQQFKSELDEKQWNDLTRFEGNANGFRILCNANNKGAGGIRLSYPTLAAFTKYPKESLPLFEKLRASEKKFGFFQSEKNLFEDIANILGLKKIRKDNYINYCRHPLAFLVEAADDICYSIIDFEDGLRLKLIDFSHAERLLMPIAGAGFYPESYLKLKADDEKAGYLRAVAIKNLIIEMAKVFVASEEEMLEGNFDISLIELSKYSSLIKEIKAITLRNVYKAKQVLEIEAAGFEVIGGLLDVFTTAVNHSVQTETKHNYYHSKKILELLPEHYFHLSEMKNSDLYTRLIKICEFVAGMTDRHAIGMYRKIKGIDLPA